MYGKFALILTLFISLTQAQVRITADIKGNQEISIAGMSKDADSKIGITVGFDKILNQSSTMSFGVGGEYQLSRELEYQGENSGKFSFSSIYGLGRFSFSDKAFGFGRVGYALLFEGDNTYKGDSDLKGGIMFGVGGGFMINDQIGIEAGYYSNSGTVELSDSGTTIKADVKYTRINAGLIYTF